MPQNSGNSNDQLEKSRLQSKVLDYKRSRKLVKAGIIAIAIILVLLLIFLTSGWNSYRASVAEAEVGAQGEKGDPGQDGAPGQPGQPGADGQTPYVGENGNWWVGDTDLGVSATGSEGSQGEQGEPGDPGQDGSKGDKGDKGEDGKTPYIGENGNWWIGDTDTGVPATGGGGGTGGNPPVDEGSFTVQLGNNNGNKSIAVSETRGFANPTDHLNTNGINNAWNITLSDIPVETVDSEIGGSNNGHDYFAYTFFLKNTGTETLDYNELLTLTENKLDAIKAVRFMLYRDGESRIYASPAKDGSKEEFACDESF